MENMRVYNSFITFYALIHFVFCYDIGRMVLLFGFISQCT